MVLDQNSERLAAKHRSSGLLIDSNLLLLLAMGIYDPRRIERFKRTARYANSDYQRLRWFTQRFDRLWTTPNILTEVDNLGRQLPRNETQNFSIALARLINEHTEKSESSSKIAGMQDFKRFGLTDAVTLAGGNSYLLLSDDLPLYSRALSAGMDAINFNHIRA